MPTEPIERASRVLALGVILAAGAACAQEPDEPPPPPPVGLSVPDGPDDPPPPVPAPGPVPGVLAPPPGPFGCATCGRTEHHVHGYLRDHFIGRPQFFAEPPLGQALYTAMTRQKNKGDVHTFTLYRSDFLAGTATLSPAGARRLSFLASRLYAWPGPVVVEWTPDRPDMALARRAAVVAALHGANLPFPAERVVVGPSAYRGLMGPDAGNNHDALIFRDFSAPRSFSLSPTSTAEFGGGSR